jgi:hypothetical protein
MIRTGSIDGGLPSRLSLFFTLLLDALIYKIKDSLNPLPLQRIGS